MNMGLGFSWGLLIIQSTAKDDHISGQVIVVCKAKASNCCELPSIASVHRADALSQSDLNQQGLSQISPYEANVEIMDEISPDSIDISIDIRC